MTPPASWIAARRLGGLRRFALAITLLNVLGHTVLGFEQSWAQPLVALAAAYATELLLAALDARLAGRPLPWAAPRDARAPRPAALLRLAPPRRAALLRLVDALLAPHITGLAVAMLTYANERLAPVAFASAAAIASKYLLRVPVGGGRRHVLNPSNAGITLTLLLFPWVGIAQPYQFTEDLGRLGDVLLPALIVVTGSLLNTRFTRRITLVAAWLAAFAVQALLRALLFGTPPWAGLVPMTGVAFLLFTFYMITDPATTPDDRRGQVLFGVAVAAAYGVLMRLHVVFGLFFALSLVSAGRGVLLAARARLARRAERTHPLAAALPAPLSPVPRR
jgi:hypothetical protein